MEADKSLAALKGKILEKPKQHIWRINKQVVEKYNNKSKPHCHKHMISELAGENLMLRIELRKIIYCPL